MAHDELNTTSHNDDWRALPNDDASGANHTDVTQAESIAAASVDDDQYSLHQLSDTSRTIE